MAKSQKRAPFNKKKSRKNSKRKPKMGQLKSKVQKQKITGNEYQKSVQEPWFSLIQNGIKKIEGRPNKGMFKKLKKGDIVVWINDITGKRRECRTLITNVRIYKSFHEMIETEGITNVLPATGAGIITVDDGVNKVYRQWYNEDMERQSGVAAIEMKVL